MSRTRVSGARFVDHSDVVLRTLGSNCEAAIEQAGNAVVEAVLERMLTGYTDVHGLPNNPHTEIWDTGALFGSIDAAMTRDSQNAYTVGVGTDIPYAVYVHDGTRKLLGRPFMSDGAADALPEVKRILTNGIPNGL